MTTVIDSPALDHLGEDDLRLLVTGRGQIAPDRSRHLAECNSCRSILHSVAVSFHNASAVTSSFYPERRSTPRRHVDDPCMLRVLWPFSPNLQEARILDVSKYGAKIRSPIELQPSSIIHVCLEASLCLAEVRHCTPHFGAFLVGVRIDDVFPLARTLGLQS